MSGPSQPALGIPCQSQQLETIIGLLQLDKDGRLEHPGVARLGPDSTERRLGHWWATVKACGRGGDVPAWDAIVQALKDHFARERVPWPSVEDAFNDGFEPTGKHHLTPDAVAALTASIAMGRDAELLPAEVVRLWGYLMEKVTAGARIPSELT